MAVLDYQASNEVLTDFSPVPAGWYLAQIVASDVAPTRNGQGSQLKLTWIVMDGEHTGRKVFDRVTLQNTNPKAVEIGRKQLNTICAALGLGGVGDSTDLHDRPCWIDVRVKPADGQYSAGNEVKNYKSEEAFNAGNAGAAPAAPVAAQASAPRAAVAAAPVAPAQPAPAGNRPPWASK